MGQKKLHIWTFFAQWYFCNNEWDNKCLNKSNKWNSFRTFNRKTEKFRKVLTLLKWWIQRKRSFWPFLVCTYDGVHKYDELKKSSRHCILGVSYLFMYLFLCIMYLCIYLFMYLIYVSSFRCVINKITKSVEWRRREVDGKQIICSCKEHKGVTKKFN